MAMSLSDHCCRATMRLLPLRISHLSPARHFTSAVPRVANTKTNQMQSLFPRITRTGDSKPAGPSAPATPRTPQPQPQPHKPRSPNLPTQILKARASERMAAQAAQAEEEQSRKNMERTLARRWNAGDVYSPHDLSGTEMSKWEDARPRGRPRRDVFDELGIDPRKHYLNFAMMAEYVTHMGRIKSGLQTGLRARNQRRISKAIRRAQGLGLMPKWYKHPELLRGKFERMR